MRAGNESGGGGMRHVMRTEIYRSREPDVCCLGHALKKLFRKREEREGEEMEGEGMRMLTILAACTSI